MIRKLVLIVGVVILAGCTSFRESEKLRVAPSAHLTSLYVYLRDVQITKTSLQAVAPTGQKANFVRARKKAASEIPLLQELLRKGVKKDLEPELKKYVDLNERPAKSKESHTLIIEPTTGAVECGSGSVICQTSIRVRVSLNDGEGTLWWDN